MRKLLATLTPCIIICVLISSCSSNVSIAKRHYRGGYYVHYTKKVSTPTASANEATKPNAPRRISVTSIPYPEKQPVITMTPTEDVPSISANTVAVPENVKYKNSTSFIEKSIKQPGIADAPVTETVQDKQSSHETIQGNDYDHDGGGGAALSLLWIVIVIILIIWLIGILAGNFGIGGLINLLLVIALILLILWLLRIA